MRDIKSVLDEAPILVLSFVGGLGGGLLGWAMGGPYAAAASLVTTTLVSFVGVLFLDT